jgi:hypothetical protein
LFLAAGLAIGFAIATVLPTHADSSGETGMGYNWTDSQRPGQITAFQWVDIADPNARIAALSDCDDCLVDGVPISFEFPFYGEAYTTVGISSNGAIQFVDTDDPWGPGRLPTSELVGPVILPLWGDWDPSSSGDIYVQTLPSWPGTGQRAFVVQWNNVESWDCGRGDNATWQAALLEDGSIVFQYLDTIVSDLECNHGADMTIGIQQGFSECFVMYSHRFASVPNRTAITWSPQSSFCDQPEPTPTTVSPPATVIEPSDPAEPSPVARDPVGLPNDGSGPTDVSRTWTVKSGGTFFVIVGATLVLLGFRLQRGRKT